MELDEIRAKAAEISVIFSAHMTAAYMTKYGLENLTSFEPLGLARNIETYIITGTISESISPVHVNIKDNVITWSDRYANGMVYEGNFGKKNCFKITRGMVIFSLKIINDEIISNKRVFNSTELIKLQKIANDILQKNTDFLRKFKSLS